MHIARTNGVIVVCTLNLLCYCVREWVANFCEALQMDSFSKLWARTHARGHIPLNTCTASNGTQATSERICEIHLPVSKFAASPKISHWLIQNPCRERESLQNRHTLSAKGRLIEFCWARVEWSGETRRHITYADRNPVKCQVVCTASRSHTAHVTHSETRLS